MANPVVSLDSDFAVYADVDTADAYMDGALHGDLWRSADDDTKGRALVTATRVLDRQLWQDAYNTYELRLAVPNIVNASIEMALALIQGNDLQNSTTTAEKVRSLAAGSVRIENFRGIDLATRFPTIVQELLAPYLAGYGATFVSKAAGTDGVSIFPTDFSYSSGI